MENKMTESVVNVSGIETVSKEKQASELQDLELQVFDHSILEKGIIAQVENAISHKERENSKRRLEDDEGEVEEGEIVDDDDDGEKLLVKNDETRRNDDDDEEEDELTRRVRQGEVTPFEALTQNRNASDDKKENPYEELERYLESQAKYQTKRKIQKKAEPSLKSGPSPIKLKRANKPKEFVPEEKPSKIKAKEPTAKGKRRHDKETPKKKRKVSGSESEYVPSEASSDEDDRHSSKRTKRKREKDADDSDFSEWDSSGDERFTKRKGNKELDDGDVDYFCKRTKNLVDELYSDVDVIDGLFKCPKVVWNKLYLYQQIGVKWFWELNTKGCGGILGDEMGLGKTIQVVAFLASVHASQITDFETNFKGLGPTLVVCPATVMHQWVREFHKWFPPIRAAILHGSGTYTGKSRTRLVDSIGAGSVLITTYTGLIKYQKKLTDKSWHYVILDEGHKIRNECAQVTKVAKELATPHRLILSGSPLQNNLKELWSLFDFIYPGKLGTLQAFTTSFQTPIMQGGYVNASQLQVTTAFKCATILKDTITPFLLRRMKRDVDSHINLPPKTEQVLFCKLSDEQRTCYKHFLNTVSIESMVRGRADVFVALTNLRKICNHPDLYTGGPRGDLTTSKTTDTLNESDFGYWKRAGKMIVIQTLLKIWFQQKHRVLLFTQGKKMLQIMENFVKRSGYKYLKLDGQTAISGRQPLIDKFNQDESYFVMLLTTKVGGLGINLTGANRVVIYDPDWNPATDSQARERAWRIGQERDVTIYRLITAGTIEEKIYHRQIFKQFLSNRVLKDPKQRRFFKSNDLSELFTLSETIKDGTNETAAIFAGTGSEVEVPPKKKLKIPDPEPPSVTFSQAKIEQMKKLAQMLSKKFAQNTSGTTTTSSSAAAATVPAVKENNNDSVYGPDGSLAIVPTSTAAGDVAMTKTTLEPSQDENKKDDEARKKKKSKLGEFEGAGVPYLIKCKKEKRSKREESKHKLSQDQYVLSKLFSKTGIETALKHDKIIEDGPSDYAIIEAESERIAKQAVKTLTESRSQITAPKTLFFRTKLSNHGGDGILAAIKKRNLLLDSTDFDQKLAENLVSWLKLKGGTTTTEQLINEFQSKVDSSKSSLFKHLLSEVAIFSRREDKIGYWTLKDELND